MNNCCCNIITKEEFKINPNSYGGGYHGGGDYGGGRHGGGRHGGGRHGGGRHGGGNWGGGRHGGGRHGGGNWGGGRYGNWRRRHASSMWPWSYWNQPIIINPEPCCITSTVRDPEKIGRSIRGGVNFYDCEPGSERETCFCKDNCRNNNNWWNCSSPKIGGQGVGNSNC